MSVWIDQRRQAGGLWRTPLRDRVPGVEHGEDKLVLRNVVEELISVPFLKRQDKKEKGQDDKEKKEAGSTTGSCLALKRSDCAGTIRGIWC
jgi:hypothetical protein